MLEIRKTLVLSTGHVSKETADILNNRPLNRWPCCGGPYADYGWFVYAHDDNCGEGESLIPDDLFAVMTFARSQGCDNILFDCDGSQIEDLPFWEW